MESTKNVMHQITKHASMFLLVFALLSFIALMVFKIDYWLELFQVRLPEALAWIMAVTIAATVEGVRFSLMAASTEDISKGHTFKFWLGMLGSIALLVYEVSYMAHKVGHLWSTTDETYTNLFMFLAVLGMVLELRLCLLMKGSKAPGATEPQDKELEQPPTEEKEKNDLVNQVQFPNLGKYLGAKNKSNGSANIAK